MESFGVQEAASLGRQIGDLSALEDSILEKEMDMSVEARYERIKKQGPIGAIQRIEKLAETTNTQIQQAITRCNDMISKATTFNELLKQKEGGELLPQTHQN